jgi:TP901 family phage tail tape measure protein
MALGIKMQLVNKQELEKEYSGFLDTLSKKYNLDVKINVDTKSFSGHMHGITQEIDATQKKIQKTFAKPIVINTELSGLNKEELEKTIRSVRQNVQEISKIDIQTNKNGKIKSAIVEYKDEMGKLVRETMGWTSHLDKANNTLKKIFQTTSLNFVDNIAKQKQETAEIEKQLALYKQQLAIKDKNLRTTYDKSYNSIGMNSILSNANNLKASDFKTLSQLKDATKQIDLQVDKVTAGMRQLRKETTLAMKESDNFITTFVKDLGKLAIWSIAASIMYAPLRGLREGIVYLNELDKSLNEIRIVTGATQSEVQKLANSYNSLAKEMKVSTREIAGQAASLFRQGLNSLEVEERMRGIIQYAKISSISLEDSNKIITATANATGENIGKIIDIFALLGDTTASGADEIGEALQRVASASENSNISLEKSASWLATISSITRESASTIGRSINSIISRYESIKKTGFNSEDTTQLNDVVLSLSQVGITATDSQGQLRDFADVMDEVGAKFNTLSKNEKAYITTTLFG